MMRRSGLVAAVVAGAVGAAGAAGAQPGRDDGVAEALTIAAMRLGAVDVDASVAFYTEHFGLTLIDRYEPGTAVLQDAGGIYVVITPSERAVEIGPGDCFARINFIVPDLDAKVAELEGAGVAVERGGTSAVGDFVTVVDPSGHPCHVKGTTPGRGAVESTRVYNMGISVSDMPSARRFYEDVLGFTAFSEDYYPPVVPMDPVNGIQFILSDRDATDDSPYDEGADAWAGLAFETHDLGAAIERLQKAGVEFAYTEPIDRDSPVWLVEFSDPFGNIHELIEHKASAPSDLAWLAPLAGSWVSAEEDGSRMEEVWLAPAAGDMTGSQRWLSPTGEARMYELMSIVRTDDGPEMRLRHFDSDMNPWSVEADSPMRFRVVRGPGGQIRFEAIGEAARVETIVYDLRADRLDVTLDFSEASGREDIHIPFERTE